MLFDDDLLAQVREDPVTATISVCQRAIDNLNPELGIWTPSEWDTLLEAYALLVEIIASEVLPVRINYPRLVGNMEEDCKEIAPWISEIKDTLQSEEAKLRVESLRSKFRNSLTNGFAYEFSTGDLEQIQRLVNELRTQISNNQQLEKEHQQRLLRRLEKLQAELHKRVSDLDRFWGLIGDAGVVLGKLGNDAKPIVDRVREIADIVWNTQSRAEELPSGTKLPMLEYKNPGNDEN